MAYTTIDDPTIYFNTKLYTGNGSTGHAITGVGFQPDWVWLKNRNTTNTHEAFDSVRGATKTLYPDRSDAEYVNATGSLTSFNSDGFTVGSGDGANKSGSGIASWNWKAGGSASSNTDGSITSTVSANTTAGFSIVSYTGTGSNATVGHGLGAVPYMMIIKKRNSATSSNWMVYHQSISGTGNGHIWLDLTNDRGNDVNSWNNTAPTSSVFSIGTRSENNASGSTYIAYCFSEVKSFSKFGSYFGNGSNDGSYIHLGFKPAFFMVKRTDTTNDWQMHDSTRDTFNGVTQRLMANLSDAEATTGAFYDFTSTGVKCRNTDFSMNASGGTYIYMAFAESPFTNSNGVPNNAR